MHLALLNWFNTKWGSLYCKPGQTLQSEVTLLQNVAGITEWGKHYYKLGQVSVQSGTKAIAKSSK